MKKPLLLLVLFTAAFSFCIVGAGQNVEVSLEVAPYSPFILKYSKEQMTKKLLDTVISSGHSRFLELGRDINFYAKGNTLRKPDVSGYRLELKVVDTTFVSKKLHKEVHSVMIHSKFYEDEIPAVEVKGWTNSASVSYSLLGGNIEDDAIMEYLGWAKIAAGITLDWSLPLSLTERIPAKNVFEKDDVARFESIREIVVIIDSQGIETSRKEDVDKIVLMINNIFFSCQNSFAKRKKTDNIYFNYYVTTDPYGYSGKTLYNNLVELKFVLKSIGNGDYQIKTDFDEKRYFFGGYSGTPLERKPILVTAETLRRMPSKINYEIAEFVSTFVRSNLD